MATACSRRRSRRWTTCAAIRARRRRRARAEPARRFASLHAAEAMSTSRTRVEIVEQQLDSYLEGARPAPRRLADDEPLRAGSGLTARKARELFEDMVLSRALDVGARELKKTNRSFYTISSAGHELNAILGAELRLTDPCFLHYRSGG